MSRIVDTSRRRVVLGVLKCVKNCVIVCQKWVFGDFVKRFLLWKFVNFFSLERKKVKKIGKKLKFFLFKNKFLTIITSYSFFVFFIFIVIFQKILILVFVEYFLELWWFWIIVLFERGKFWRKKVENLFCCVFFEKCYSKINNIFKKLKNKNENLWKMKKEKCYL